MRPEVAVMAEAEVERTVAALLDRYQRRSFAEQAEIRLGDAPNVQYQVFQLALLLDSRVGADVAVEAFLDLRGRRLSTVGGVVGVGTDTIVQTLTGHGYDESDATRAATAMTDAALHLQEDYGNRLEELRDAAQRDPAREREMLRRFAQTEDTAIDALFREMQAQWRELSPFADKKVLDAAGRLGLPTDERGLRGLVRDDDDFVRLDDCLVRLRQEGENGYEAVRAAAQAG